MSLDQRLQGAVERAGRDKELGGIVASVHSGEGASWTGSVGELSSDKPFYAASVTKLYTAAIIHRLKERGVLDYEDKLVDRVEPGLVDGLHVSDGADSTGAITLRHLMSHTSGLPDYFLGKRADGRSLEEAIRDGDDFAWSVDDVIGWAREMGPVFLPGRPGKALYSDTNYQLLGRVIEVTTGQTYEAALKTEVFDPLGLSNSWLYTDATDTRAVPMRDGAHRLEIPKAMTSFGPDGGIVSDVGDLMTFLRGFFEGRLFDASVLEGMMEFNRVMYPLESGTGILRFRVPRIFDPLGRQPHLIGHSGLSGAFAFTAPVRGVYLAGTVNNISKPGRSFRLMLRLLNEMRREG